MTTTWRRRMQGLAIGSLLRPISAARCIRSSNCRFSAAAYADKNERDFARLENSAAAGQIAVERGF
jgi:hypothetical protein